jgi:uncharacterized LabA/DUF88 family protein
MTDRIALFIDGPGLHYAAKNLGFDIDYRRLLQEFSRFGRVLRAFFYTGTREADKFNSARPLIDWLEYNGFTVRAKSVKEFDDGEGRRKMKRNIGVDLAVDALEIAALVDHIFLFSGDGDLRVVAAAMQRKGVRISVVSSLRTQPPMIADELRRQADNFIELEVLRKSIERPPHPVNPG